MSDIVVQAFVTLDGVSQAPGASDEDVEGDFPYGGWQDREVAPELIAEWEGRVGSLLLGRKTYQLWAGAWGVWPEDAPGLMGELTRRYNSVPKYVASRTLRPEDLTWQRSQLLEPDVPSAVAELRAHGDGEIRVWGSTELVRTLAEHDLVYEYRLLVYPLVLGTGKRLFGEGFPFSRLELVENRQLPKGVLLNVYRPDRMTR